MTALRTAAQQALEAMLNFPDDISDDMFESITALKAALARQAGATQEPHRDLRAALQAPGCERLREWVEIGPVQRAALETFVETFALAQEQAEPVEPVAYVHRQGNYWEVSERHLDSDEKARGWTEEPLYTAPPQRKPLTDEEIDAEWQKASECAYSSEAVVTTSQFVRLFTRAVERAHGIGDNT